MSFSDTKIAFEQRAKAFCRLRNADHLAALLGFATYTLQLQAAKPHYHLFSVPKKDGSRRWLENPDKILKTIQSKLNDYLQSVYWFHITEAAYGFIDNPANTPAPRHIHSNAAQHLGRPWLLNVDLEDFFHNVKAETIFEVFRDKPFHFPDELSQLLMHLTTHQGRLPMGAPTSPVLSNFAVIPLDHDLLALAREQEWTFTRYADDMSFSAFKEIDIEHLALIGNLVSRYGYRFNDTKVKFFGPGDEKFVTGLKLGKEQVELPDQFVAALNKEIGILAGIVSANDHFWHRRSAWLEKLQGRLEGMLRFAELTLGENDPEYQQLQRSYFEALEPPDDTDSLSWMEFPYL